MPEGKYILFDMDGVITSEEGYWRAAECALLDFAARLGRPHTDNTDALPWSITLDTRVIAQVKNLSINTNWDLCHIGALVLIARLCAHDPANLHALRAADWNSDAPIPLNWPADAELRLNVLVADAITHAGTLRGFAWIESLADSFGDAAPLFVRRGPVWEWLFRRFQIWFNGGAGGDFFPARKGIIHDERLLLDPGAIADCLRALRSAGWQLGVATGRTRGELLPTLTRFGLLEFFERDSIVTHDEVAAAENRVSAHLSKPNPFQFLRALYPEREAVTLAIEGCAPLGERIVIIGDTVGDMAGAKAIGARAVGVLTGPAGTDARDTLRDAGATLIVNDMTELPLHFAQ